MSEGVFLLFYSHLGLFQFIILLAIRLDGSRTDYALNYEKPTEMSAESQSPSSGNKIKRLWFPLACVGLLGFELLWQVNLILYQKDLVLPLLLTILSIPFGLLLFSIGNRLLLIASGQTELMDPRIVNQGYPAQGCGYIRFSRSKLICRRSRYPPASAMVRQIRKNRFLCVIWR